MRFGNENNPFDISLISFLELNTLGNKSFNNSNIKIARFIYLYIQTIYIKGFIYKTSTGPRIHL